MYIKQFFHNLKCPPTFLVVKKWNGFVVLFVALFAFLIFTAAYYVVFLDTHLDEAQYSYTAWLTADGLAFPFEDFRIKYGPIGFYSQVLLQNMAGPSMFAARVISMLFFVGFSLLLFDVVRRLGNRWWALFAVALLAFQPFLVGNYVAATPYALVAFLSMLSVWFLLWPALGKSWRIVCRLLLEKKTFTGD